MPHYMNYVSDIIGALAPLLVAIVSIVASNKLVVYRIDKLEEKVDKHNSVVERMAVAESNLDTVWIRYDDLKEDIEKIENRLN